MQRLTHILSRPAVWMIAVLLIAFWQVAFCRYTMQWDMTEQAFVWHRFISECFHIHILPLWAPYSRFGYPMYADPQSGLFYPLTWLFTVGHYTLYSNNLEYIIHIMLAAFGMKYLLESISVTRSTAAVFALVYVMSGPFVGHASHLMLIGSLCWMPFVFGSYIRFVTGYRIYHLLLTALFVFLQLTGGYAGTTVIMIYVLIILFAYHFIAGILSHQATVSKTAVMHLLLAIVTVVVSAGYLYAVTQGQPNIDRGEGISRMTAGNVPFTAMSMLTMIYPGAVGSDQLAFGTNITMQDMYTGIIPLLLMVAVVLLRRRLSSYLIFAGAIFWLLAAMGDHTPVRGWMYDLLPGMKLFRHAGIFRFFTCIGIIVLAARGFDALDQPGNVQYIRVFTYLLIGAVLLITSIAICMTIGASGLHALSFVFQSQNAFLIVLLLACIALLNLDRFSWTVRRNMICVLILAEMIVSVQWDMHKTIVSDRRLNIIQSHLDKYQKGFPIPENVSLTSCNQWNDSTIAPPIWQNAGFIRKQVSFEGFNGFNLKNYNELASQPDFYQKYEKRKLLESSTGTEIRLSAFDPDHFSFDVNSDKDQVITLGQMYFPGWKAVVDTNETTVTESPDHFVSRAVGAGAHHVEISFAPRGAKAAFIYTIGIVVLLLSAIAIARRRLS
ncbi:MAG: putative rane protein [Bacteroidetes bacterium]|nr:putative rane protein [Bacteroidota bacterium]